MIRRALAALVVLVAAAFVLLVVARVAGVVRTWRIPAASMEPTLHCARPGFGCRSDEADRLLSVSYLFGDPQRGDVVAFRTPPLARVRCGAGGVYVKRIVALPGERVEERRGRIYVGGRPLAEPYVPARERDMRTLGPLRVPQGRYFLLGDNRVASCDSRVWGSVRRSAILGKVVLRYWPPGRFGSL